MLLLLPLGNGVVNVHTQLGVSGTPEQDLCQLSFS